MFLHHEHVLDCNICSSLSPQCSLLLVLPRCLQSHCAVWKFDREAQNIFLQPCHWWSNFYFCWCWFIFMSAPNSSILCASDLTFSSANSLSSTAFRWHSFKHQPDQKNNKKVMPRKAQLDHLLVLFVVKTTNTNTIELDNSLSWIVLYLTEFLLI